MTITSKIPFFVIFVSELNVGIFSKTFFMYERPTQVQTKVYFKFLQFVEMYDMFFYIVL